MYHHLRRTFGVTLGLLGLASPLVCAAAPPSTPPPAAQLVAVKGASHPYRLMDYDHRVITAAVPAQSLTDVQTRHPDGTVQATVATIDFATGRLQAATEAGQVLVLAIPRAELGSLMTGDTITLVVPHQPHHAKVAHRPRHAKAAGDRQVAQSQ
jgi:hypothetical protein